MLRAGLDSTDPTPAIRGTIGMANLIRFTGLGPLGLLDRAAEVGRAMLAGAEGPAEDGETSRIVGDLLSWLALVLFDRTEHEAARRGTRRRCRSSAAPATCWARPTASRAWATSRWIARSFRRRGRDTKRRCRSSAARATCWARPTASSAWATSRCDARSTRRRGAVRGGAAALSSRRLRARRGQLRL